jgi:hypothetical protein
VIPSLAICVHAWARFTLLDVPEPLTTFDGEGLDRLDVVQPDPVLPVRVPVIGGRCDRISDCHDFSGRDCVSGHGLECGQIKASQRFAVGLADLVPVLSPYRPDIARNIAGHIPARMAHWAPFGGLIPVFVEYRLSVVVPLWNMMAECGGQEHRPAIVADLSSDESRPVLDSFVGFQDEKKPDRKQG